VFIDIGVVFYLDAFITYKGYIIQLHLHNKCFPFVVIFQNCDFILHGALRFICYGFSGSDRVLCSTMNGLKH